MNKSELIAELAKATDATKVSTEGMLDAFLDVVTSTLRKGDEIRLVGFGTFGVASRKARTGHNPQTGEEIKIPARKVPVFKAGKELKERVN